MKKDPKNFLVDILFSIDRIEKTIKGRSFSKFEEDLDVQDVVIRRVSVIGEALNNMPAEFKKKHPEIKWSEAIGMRNLLIHEYFDIDLKIVWNTINDDLAKLRSQIVKALKEM